MEKKNIKILIGVIIAIVVIVIGVILVMNLGKVKETEVEEPIEQTSNVENNEVEENNKKQGKVDIIDINSKSRPYAIVINNTPVAVKVQEGLNDAYLVYEIPTEGNTSRILALYKDIKEDLTVGTVRSARHNFIDFALESDAILCCYGWSHYAEDEMKAGKIDYMQGLTGSSAFFRKNPENLASEHTAYASFDKIKSAAEKSNFRTVSDDSILLKYDVEDVDLSTLDNAKVANNIVITYGSAQNTSSFKYDEETKMYYRSENDKECKDHNTKEAVSTKNIIVEKLGYEMCSDNYYWNLNTTGKGEGYYITNGYAVSITWSKNSRSSKTKYMYKEGTIIDGKDVGGQEINVSDGRTWIEVQTTKQETKIN